MPDACQAQHARIAQLVEHNLAKVGVASSNLVSRSTKASHFGGLFSLSGKGFRGSETWEVWLVKQRLTSLGVLDAADGKCIRLIDHVPAEDAVIVVVYSSVPKTRLNRGRAPPKPVLTD
jgi:hypothetical protein